MRRRLAGEVFSERNNGRRFCCLAENGWKQWKMNVAERMEGGREWKQEQNREGKEARKQGSEKAAAAARVERFAVPSSFLSFLSILHPRLPARRTGRGKFPLSKRSRNC